MIYVLSQKSITWMWQTWKYSSTFEYTIKFSGNLYNNKWFVKLLKMEIQALKPKKPPFLKDFKALKKQWWISSTFKHFKDLYEPCSYLI